MKPARSFGMTPILERARVRVEHLQGKTVVSTKSFAIYGYEYDTVLETVEQALADAFSEPAADQPKSGVMKVKKRRRA